MIDPQLSIVANLFSGQVVLPARAHMGREPLRLIVRSDADLATAEGAGAAVASLFSGDRQKAAWAWASIWPRAAAGEQADGAVMPKTRAERGALHERCRNSARLYRPLVEHHCPAGCDRADKLGSRARNQNREHSVIVARDAERFSRGQRQRYGSESHRNDGDVRT